MTELKAFIQVLVENELPGNEGNYFTDQGIVYYNNFGFTQDPLPDQEYPKYWLKEISLTELMEEFASDMVSIDWNYEEKTYKELLTEFLKQKGML